MDEQVEREKVKRVFVEQAIDDGITVFVGVKFHPGQEVTIEQQAALNKVCAWLVDKFGANGA